MSKTTATIFIANVKGGPIDYDITDSDLDDIIIRQINKALPRIKNFLKQRGYTQDVTALSTFKTIAGQDFVDILRAHIVGDKTTFTGVASDKIDVTIDATTTSDIDIAASTTIALVVAAINSAVGSTVASEDDNGFLQIQSATSGATSVATIADDGASSGAVDRLFSVSAERTQSAITDLDSITKLTERVNNTSITIKDIAWLRTFQPDPDSSSGNIPDFAARSENRIYFANTPSQAILIYMNYFKLIVKITSSDTLPFDDMFDPLLEAMVNLNLTRLLDATNAVSIADYKQEIKDVKKDLIIGEGYVVRQAASRNNLVDSISPQPPSQMGTKNP